MMEIGAKLTSDLLLLVVAIFDAGKENGGLVGEDETILLEVGVTSIQDGVQHALIQKEVAHPLRDDNVNLGERHLNLLHLSLDKGDLVGQAVGLDNLAGLEDDGGHVDTNYVLGASLGSKPGCRCGVSLMLARIHW
jgi:hypothetical protein